MKALRILSQTISQCTQCPRLTKYRREIAKNKRRQFQEWTYWGRPVPGFGDPKAHLLVIGLAPAAHGGNRTGRVFTGDRSGDWLHHALHMFKFSNQPTSTHRNDGLRLRDCYIVAVVRCAPPGNKPLQEEFAACQPYLVEELNLLRHVTVVVALGKIAFDEYIRTCRKIGYSIPKPTPKFGHGKIYALPWDITLIGSYHPSQQNTFTGKLTRQMFHQVFKLACTFLGKRKRTQS